MSKSSEPGPAPPIWTLPPPPPRQRALGREEIVASASALADEAGAGALTMKAVAARLGSYSPMALYRYVHSKDGLVDLMLDAVIAEVPVPDRPGDDWRADLHAVATHTRRMIERHPWYAVLTHTRPPVGPHMMRRLDFMLAVLTSQGGTLAGQHGEHEVHPAAGRPAHDAPSGLHARRADQPGCRPGRGDDLRGAYRPARRRQRLARG